MIDYIRDPKAIYAESFRLIEGELAQRGLTRDALSTRLIHACGMIDIVDDIDMSEGAFEIGRDAIRSGAPIFCDAEMVARGIIKRALPAGSEPIVTLNDPLVPEISQTLETTRSAAAVELWADRLQGAVVVIGNAPTALFHLLKGLENGWARPALIIGMPVGFVGAAESKVALAQSNPTPFITVHGRRGGSALASAAVNALTLGLGGDGT